MNRYPLLLLIPLLAILFNSSFAAASASVITLDDYRSGIGKGWREKVFKGRTSYTASVKDGVPCIAAVSHASASALYFDISYDPKTMPILSWQWRIDHVLAKADATKKSGDDSPARVYVVFKSPILFWWPKALTYIWDNRLPKGTIIRNVHTRRAMMIVLESGPALEGRWVREERNIRQDYIRAFGEEPPEVEAIAIMTDTDDTGETAEAWYGPIRIMKVAEAPARPAKQIDPLPGQPDGGVDLRLNSGQKPYR
jgi:hypothetical protein